MAQGLPASGRQDGAGDVTVGDEWLGATATAGVEAPKDCKLTRLCTSDLKRHLVVGAADANACRGSLLLGEGRGEGDAARGCPTSNLRHTTNNSISCACACPPPHECCRLAHYHNSARWWTRTHYCERTAQGVFNAAPPPRLSSATQPCARCPDLPARGWICSNRNISH